MKVMLCENADWLLSEEAFSIYASCMYHPTYKDYKGQMDDLLCDPSTKVFVYEDQGRKTAGKEIDKSELAGMDTGTYYRKKRATES